MNLKPVFYLDLRLYCFYKRVLDSYIYIYIYIYIEPFFLNIALKLYCFLKTVLDSD